MILIALNSPSDPRYTLLDVFVYVSPLIPHAALYQGCGFITLLLGIFVIDYIKIIFLDVVRWIFAHLKLDIALILTIFLIGDVLHYRKLTGFLRTSNLKAFQIIRICC